MTGKTHIQLIKLLVSFNMKNTSQMCHQLTQAWLCMVDRGESTALGSENVQVQTIPPFWASVSSFEKQKIIKPNLQNFWWSQDLVCSWSYVFPYLWKGHNETRRNSGNAECCQDTFGCKRLTWVYLKSTVFTVLLIYFLTLVFCWRELGSLQLGFIMLNPLCDRPGGRMQTSVKSVRSRSCHTQPSAFTKRN